jgi:putative flippase GtrA
MKSFIRRLVLRMQGLWFRHQELRYLLVGVTNTVAGYLVGVGSYDVLKDVAPVFIISILASAISITLSFCNYKIFVFKKHGQWIQEYLRSLVIYSGMAMFSALSMVLMMDWVKTNIWVAQAVTMLFTTVIGYFSHKKYTFAGNKPKQTPTGEP